MILTRDNLLNFVKQKGAVTPTDVAGAFDTSTMIASAALSDVAKEKLILITHLKLSSSPYYYDPKQKECLYNLGLEFYKKYEKEILIKLKEREVLPDNSLTIQEKLAIENIRDFAIPININTGEKSLIFWVWYLRDIDKTKSQLLELINNQNKPKIVEKTSNDNILSKVEVKKEQIIFKNTKKKEEESNKNVNFSSEESQVEIFIENYLKENYLKVETKSKKEKGILYETKVSVNKIRISIDCFYFYKKVSEADLIKFYTSSIKPKIVFIEKCPKKIFTLAEGLDNLTVINI